MNPLQRSPLHASVFALAVTAGALLICMLLRPILEPDLFLPFIAVVWLSAWRHGTIGGIIATAASSAAMFFFFLAPGFSVAVPSANAAVRLLSFIAAALLLTWLTASWMASRTLFASTLSSVGEAVAVTDREGHVTFLNPVAETLTGWPAAEARGKRVDEVMKLVNEKTREAIENPLLKALRERVMVTPPEPTLLLSKAGAEVPVEHSAAPVRDDSGELRGGILVFRDISARRHLEEQLTHSQKMDAVGRLAGGVAGDFNNVLTVITGYAELLRAELPSSSPMRRFVDEIIYAGERAAALTRHLLAFSRGTSAQPKVLDLNAVVAGMEPMLRRLLGQNIELILLNSPGLGRVKMDASQVEQVIVNLTTNARDAMPQGGKLVIETANVDLDDAATSKNLGVKPGSYVMVAVSDTGVGMDTETRSRLFEPFFTTKAPGKGSGLGLATVYGVIKQSDGQVTVYSQPGCGTIFEVYLPRVKEPAAPVRRLSPRGSETILLVDDEEGVRKLVSAVLHSNGYEVLEASNASAALAAYEKNSHKVDMVLTDVVMPQMSGFELGKELTNRTPELKILYMSGYRDNPVGVGGGEVPKAFLHKPFTPDVLLSKVREVLDQQ